MGSGYGNRPGWVKVKATPKPGIRRVTFCRESATNCIAKQAVIGIQSYKLPLEVAIPSNFDGNLDGIGLASPYGGLSLVA